MMDMGFLALVQRFLAQGAAAFLPSPELAALFLAKGFFLWLSSLPVEPQ